jgi:AAA domain
MSCSTPWASAAPPPTRPIEFAALLKDALSERFRVLVCDEAQWLSRECFELWRHLWDDRRTDIAIVFVGGGDCYRVLRREPAGADPPSFTRPLTGLVPRHKEHLWISCGYLASGRSAAQIASILYHRHGVRVSERTIRGQVRRAGLHPPGPGRGR